jgi:hypothetical protein
MKFMTAPLFGRTDVKTAKKGGINLVARDLSDNGH